MTPRWTAESWDRDRGPVQLTWDQFKAGRPCPGCGRPYIGLGPSFVLEEQNCLERLKDGPVDAHHAADWFTGRGHRHLSKLGLNGLVSIEDDKYSITELGHQALDACRDNESWLASHRATHPKVNSHSFCAGSIQVHCGLCCPPPPLSPEQLARIANIIRPTLERTRALGRE
jgi:hypothetical protein